MKLNHAQTPTALKEVNSEIIALLSEEQPDFAKVKAVFTVRDSIIRLHLESLAPEDKQEFAKLEYDVNNMLSEMAQSLLDQSKDDITKFVRSRSAVKNYK